MDLINATNPCYTYCTTRTQMQGIYKPRTLTPPHLIILKTEAWAPERPEFPRQEIGLSA
jgi:hypothetical protein